MREKLIELLDALGIDDDWYTNGEIADHIIANGVTVQQWIPVSERLPKIYQPVLVKYLSYNDGSADPAYVAVAVLLDGNAWTWWEGALGDCDDEVKCTITHWMPLPQPPKEG